MFPNINCILLIVRTQFYFPCLEHLDQNMVYSVYKPLCAECIHELRLDFSQESLVFKHLFLDGGAVCEGYGTFRRKWSLSRGSRARALRLHLLYTLYFLSGHSVSSQPPAPNIICFNFRFFH